MPKIEFDVPYPRPEKLSDPYHDFSAQELRNLLLASDDARRWPHFQSILNGILPAGTYEESVFFLPMALDYMRREPYETFDCIEDVVRWTAEHFERLREDGISDATRAGIRTCFEAWTAQFKVEHYNEVRWNRMRWSPSLRDIVVPTVSVVDLITNLSRHECLADLAEACVDSLANRYDSPVRSAWMLEFAHGMREVLRILGELCELRSDHIRAVIFDQALLQRHVDRIADTLMAWEPSPTYWPNLLATLGLRRPQRN